MKRDIDDEKNHSGGIGVIGVIILACAITIMVMLFVSIKQPTDPRTEIGESICHDNSFMFGGISSNGTLICKTNATFISDHYNMTAPVFEITIQVDWGYYGVKK